MSRNCRGHCSSDAPIEAGSVGARELPVVRQLVKDAGASDACVRLTRGAPRARWAVGNAMLRQHAKGSEELRFRAWAAATSADDTQKDFRLAHGKRQPEVPSERSVQFFGMEARRAAR